MPGLADTIARLATLRGSADAGGAISTDRLQELTAFGSNPGTLKAWTYTPDQLNSSSALVVVLHGCTQSAAAYDFGSGWSQLADRYGFALLFPEQQRQNNPNLCFNWFAANDNRREHGEALSIRQMVAAMVAAHGVDPQRVFVTGLSAGGAMASVMLATYPDVFAGGAMIAGLPYGCASTVPQAFERMRGHSMPTETALAALVRDASPYHGPWPTISIWHGSGDATVNPSNADAIIAQWRSLHEVGREPDCVEAVDGYPRRVWCDPTGREVIEDYSITGMGHGTPLDTAGTQGAGTAGAFMLEASISSTYYICRFWGLTAVDPAGEHTTGDSGVTSELVTARSRLERNEARPVVVEPERLYQVGGMSTGVGKVIEDALRAAGLMR